MTEEKETLGTEEHTISGRIHSVVYQNEESGYAVLRLTTAAAQPVTAVGCVPFPAPGETIIAEGRWVTHPSHGEQFTIESHFRQMPATPDAIFEYLASGVIRGVGPSTAKQIVSLFGGEALDVIANHADRLTQIKGLSANRAKQIGATFRSQAGIQRLMELLLENELAPHLAVRLYKRYGDDAEGKLQENPYLLLDEEFGVDFDDADRLAQSQGIDEDSPLRLEAACLYTLQYNAEQGHVFIPRSLLLEAAGGMLEWDEDIMAPALDRLIERGQVRRENIGGYDACYLPPLFEAECAVARKFAEMVKTPAPVDADADALLAKLEEQQGITYAPKQRDAVRKAAQQRVMVLTGGPGTGKTTTVRALLSLYSSLHLSVALAAPTGRAAKRMADVTGRDAKTIHRLLEMGNDPEANMLTFQRHENNPLEADVVIVDEVSMVDILLMRALLAALKPGARLVLVGDADQLPAVGAGQVLDDVQKLLGRVKLKEIFRQMQESKIIMGAHAINRGELPGLKNNGGDMFFMRRSEPGDAVQTILELCATRLPQNMGLLPEQIQVLTPTRKGSCGTIELNRALQAALNPPAQNKAEIAFGKYTFREGDRVMQIRNNYDMLWTQEQGDNAGMGVFNGDIGVLIAVDNAAKTAVVRYDDRLVTYAFDQLMELEPAFAMTVHKSQGSEYDAVVLAAVRGPKKLMTRRVLYTAVTRAKKLLVLVGDDRVLGEMVQHARSRDRFSGLQPRLEDLLGKPPS